MPITEHQTVKLWKIADQLKIDPQISTLYLIGLLFFKYLSDHSSPSTDLSGNSKYLQWTIPPAAQWTLVSSDPTGKALADGIEAFEIHPDNQNLERPFTALGLAELAKNPKLFGLLCNAMVSDLKDVSNSQISAAIDALFQISAQSAGRRSGEHYTPADLSLLLAEILAPVPGSTAYDPACGTGSTLLAAYGQVQQSGSEGRPVALYGQDNNLRTSVLAKVNMILHEVESASIATGNTLLDPAFVEGMAVKQFDLVITAPPVSLLLSDSWQASLEKDPYSRFGFGLPGNLADFVFIQHVIASLSESGRAAMLVGPRVLFVSGREGETRRAILEADLVEAVISLPSSLLFNTAIPMAILVLNRAKPDNLKGKVLFVYADEGYVSGYPVRHISEEQRQKIVQTVRERREQKRFSAVATLAEIENNDFVLTPARYIDLVGIQSFLGGAVQWKELTDIATLLQGTVSVRSIGEDGTPVIRGRDLAESVIRVDDLAKASVSESTRKHLYCDIGDILIQRVGLTPRVVLAEQELKGVLAGDSVYVIKLSDTYRYLARYLVEFLNSNIGQGLLSRIVGGAAAPTLRLSDFRRLRIPIPDQAVISLINDLHQVEQNLAGRISRAREIRQQLFGIEDPEQVSTQLSRLSLDAKVLSASLVQADDLDFQIRNFYPFVLAYAYRSLSAIREPTELYKEQLRVAENILAFLGSIGLMLAIHTRAVSTPENTKLTREVLTGYWRGGISPGDWQAMGYQAGNLMRGSRQLAAADGFSSLWFRGTGSRESEFAKFTKELVQLKNDYKHDRWPRTPYEFEEGVQKMRQLLSNCLSSLSFFIQYPIRLVQHIDIEWQTGQADMDTLVYSGDHPGLRQEKVKAAVPLPTDKLYMEIDTQKWVPLYPIINVQYCPSCKTRETYMIDRWDGPNDKVVLKSFERGHVLDDDDTARAVGSDLECWLQTQFNSPKP